MRYSNLRQKNDKRTSPLTPKELETLKKLSEESRSFSQFSLLVKVERTALINTLARGSAAPATVKKIRKFLTTKLQANSKKQKAIVHE